MTRDLARGDDSDELDGAEYLLAIRTLIGFLLFLRAHGLWRRSERAVLDCWDVFNWATHEPLLAGLLCIFDAPGDERITDELQSGSAVFSRKRG